MNSSHTAIYYVHILPIYIYPAWKGPTFVAVKKKRQEEAKAAAVQREQEAAEAAQRAAEAAQAAVEELVPWIRGKTGGKLKMKSWNIHHFLVGERNVWCLDALSFGIGDSLIVSSA